MSAIRNGPVKASIGAGGYQSRVPAKSSQQPRNNATDSQNSMKQQKTAVQPKKQRPATAQHNRPSSPGIHGKVAEAPYKSYANTIKSNNIYEIIKNLGYTVSNVGKDKSKLRSTSPRQPLNSSASIKSSIIKTSANHPALRGVPPAKPKWNA